MFFSVCDASCCWVTLLFVNLFAWFYFACFFLYHLSPLRVVVVFSFLAPNPFSPSFLSRETLYCCQFYGFLLFVLWLYVAYELTEDFFPTGLA